MAVQQSLIGREQELVFLRSRVDVGQPVAVLGYVGVGKTALIRLAARSVGTSVHEGGALSTLSSVPYLSMACALGAVPPSGARTELADATAWVCDCVGSGVLVLDDLQWADRWTLSLLPRLAGRIRIVASVSCTRRLGGPDDRRAVPHGFDQLWLDPLGARDVEQLATAFEPELPRDAVTAIAAESIGRPLFVEHLARYGDSSPRLRAAAKEIVRGLSPDGRHALATLGVAGRPVDRELLGDGASELLEQCLAQDGGGGVRAMQSLCAETAIALIDAHERRQLHARLGRYAQDPGEAASQLAAAEEHKAARVKALEAAAACEDVTERARYLGLAARCLTGIGADEERVSAAAGLTSVGLDDEAVQLLGDVSPSTPSVAAEAALVLAQARAHSGDVKGAESALARGLSLGNLPREVEIRLRVERAVLSLQCQGLEQARRDTEHALKLITRSHSDPPRARLMRGLAKLRANDSGCLLDLSAVVDEARRSGDVALEVEATSELANASWMYCDSQSALALTGSMEKRASILGLTRFQARLRGQTAELQLLIDGPHPGELEALEQLLAEQRLGPARAVSAAHMGVGLAELGRLADARRLIMSELDLAATPRYRATLACGLAQVEWLAGRANAAIEAAAQCRASEPEGYTDVSALAHLMTSWALADLSRDPEQPPAETYYPAFQGVTCESVALRYLRDPMGMLVAERLFSEAAALWSVSSASSAVRCLWGAAEAARRAGAIDRARGSLISVREKAVAHNLLALIPRIDCSLRRTGVLPTNAGEKPGDSLTAREHEVMALVSAGLSGEEIARALGLACRTVESHILNGMRKLGARSRIHAAALVSAQGPSERSFMRHRNDSNSASAPQPEPYRDRKK